MPSDRPSPSVGRVIGNTLLQIVLLPLNFIIWLVTSPELITLLCILSEILIELVVSAVMAGVSIIVSAVILMEDDPEPTLIMTPPSHPKKSFLHGGDSTCKTVREDKAKEVKEHGDQTGDSSDDRKSVDSKSVDQEKHVDGWLPKYGTPRGDTTPAPAVIEVPSVDGSEPDVTQDSGEARTDEAESAKSAELEETFKDVVESSQLPGDESSEKAADSVKADSTDNERTADTDSAKTDNENAVPSSGSETAQERSSIQSNKSEK